MGPASWEIFCIEGELEGIVYTLMRGDAPSNIEAGFRLGKLLARCRETSKHFASIEPDPTAGMDKQE